MKTKPCIKQQIQHSDDVKCRKGEWRPSWLCSLFFQLEKEPSHNIIWHVNVWMNYGFIGVSTSSVGDKMGFHQSCHVKQRFLLATVLHCLFPSSFNILLLQHHKAKWNVLCWFVFRNCQNTGCLVCVFQMPSSTVYLPDTASGHVCAARLDSQIQAAERGLLSKASSHDLETSVSPCGWHQDDPGQPCKTTI